MAALSNNGFNFLKNKEGFRNVPYKLEGEKYYTVGYGHYGPDVIPGKTYSLAEIEAFFEKDAARHNNDVSKIWDSSMTQNMFDAMFSFSYNHGNISTTKLGQAIRNGGWKDKDKIVRIWTSSYCSGRYAQSLKRRRQAEVSLFYTNAPSDVEESGMYSGQFNDYTADDYTNIYSSPGANASQFNNASGGITTMIEPEQSDEHTRIYKATDSTIVLDELSLPMNQRNLEEENA